MSEDDTTIHDQISEIIAACKEVHGYLGSGFLEAVYQEALAIELSIRGIPFEREKQIYIYYKQHRLEKDYFADFVCGGNIIIETKATSVLLPEHKAQLINYLNATNISTGLLVNFGEKELIWRKVRNHN